MRKGNAISAIENAAMTKFVPLAVNVPTVI
jgi:hypothetical protein